DEDDQIVHFCYVDEGTQDIDRFTTYLRQYSRLFSALGDFRVIYAAQNDGLFEKAHGAFSELCKPALLRGLGTEPQSRELLDYFEMRRQYEAKDFTRFDTARLIRYREAKNRFGGDDYEAMYQTWLPSGFASMQAPVNPVHNKKDTRIPQFSTFVLDHDY